MPRSLDEANAMADAAELSGPARAAFVSRLTGGVAPAEKAPAAEPKAAAPAKAVTPTRTLLARPAAKAAPAVAPKAPPSRPAVYQMEEQVITGAPPTRTTLAAAPVAKMTQASGPGTLPDPSQRGWTRYELEQWRRAGRDVSPPGVTPEQNEAARLAKYGPTPMQEAEANFAPGWKAVVNDSKRPEREFPGQRPPLSPAAEMLRRAQGIDRDPVLYRAPEPALSPDADTRRTQVAEALGMPGAAPQVTGRPVADVLGNDPVGRNAYEMLIKYGEDPKAVTAKYLTSGPAGVAAMKREALLRVSTAGAR